MSLILTGNAGSESKLLAASFGALNDILKECAASAASLSGSIGKVRTESDGLAAKWQAVAAAMAAAAASGATMEGQSYGTPGRAPSGLPLAAPSGLPLAVPVGSVDATRRLGGPRTGNSLTVMEQAGRFTRPGSGEYLGAGALTVQPPLSFHEPFNPDWKAAGDGFNTANPESPYGQRPDKFSGGSVHSQAQKAATEGAMATYAIYEVIKTIADPVMRLGALKAGMEAQGIDAAHVDAAQAASFATQKGSRGTSVTGNMEIVSKLMSVVQDQDVAIALMQPFAELQVALEHTGHAGGGDELMAAIRGGEFRGVLSKLNAETGKEEVDAKGLLSFIKELMAATLVTNGAIGPKEFYQEERSGGVSTTMLEDKAFFADTIALQMAMGSARAGTGLQGFNRQFSAGRMSDAAFNLLTQMGVITDPSKSQKIGIGYHQIEPGAMQEGSLRDIRSNPVRFITEDLLPKMKEYLGRTSGDAYTKGDQKTKDAMLYALAVREASTIPGGVLIAEVLRNLPLIERDRAALTKAEGRDAYGIHVADDPNVSTQAFKAAVEASLLSIGTPSMKAAMDVLTGLTGNLNALSEWATKNPDGTKVAMTGLAYALEAFGIGTAAAAALFILTSPVTGFAALALTVIAIGKAMDWVNGKVMPVLPEGPAKEASDAGVLTLLGGIISGKRHFWSGKVMEAPPVPRDDRMRGPVEIHGAVTVLNTRDIANGANANAARALSRPSASGSGPDTRVTPPSLLDFNN